MSGYGTGDPYLTLGVVLALAPLVVRWVSRCWVETRAGPELPASLGDDFDGAVDHLDGGLIVDHVGRHGEPGGPRFDLFRRARRQPVLAIEVREHGEIDQPQPLVAAGERFKPS